MKYVWFYVLKNKRLLLIEIWSKGNVPEREIKTTVNISEEIVLIYSLVNYIQRISMLNYYRDDL